MSIKKVLRIVRNPDTLFLYFHYSGSGAVSLYPCLHHSPHGNPQYPATLQRRKAGMASYLGFFR